MSLFIVSNNHETLGIPGLISMLAVKNNDDSRTTTIIAIDSEDLQPAKSSPIERQFQYYLFDPGAALPTFKSDYQEWLVINLGLYDVPVTKRYLDKLATHLFLSTNGTSQTIVLIVHPQFIPQYLRTSNAMLNVLPAVSGTSGQVHWLFLRALAENLFACNWIVNRLLAHLKKLHRRPLAEH